MTVDGTSRATLIARITHLEMNSIPPVRVPMPHGLRLAVMRAREVPLHFYRYLYEQVGKPHHWLARRNLSDDELGAILHADHTDLHILYVDGAPGGFFELNHSQAPRDAEIVYFGIVPDFQGRGLARFLLSEAIFAAWSREPERVVISTNTLDSPRALQLYQRAGFSPYAFSEEAVQPWL